MTESSATPEFSTSVKIQVLKPPRIVYNGIIDPKYMTNYWICESSGKMEENTTVTWRFPEFKDSFTADIKKLEADRYVSFTWIADGYEDLVEMRLEAVEGGTKVTITERRFDNEDMSLQWVKGSTEGWTNFLASLKAYLEYGINLRKGAFDFLKS
jgi:uncharacterized protein YndB with AHSA1/START domain